MRLYNIYVCDICLYVCMCVCVCVLLYMCIYIYTQEWSTHESEMLGYRLLFMMRTHEDMLEKTSGLLAFYPPPHMTHVSSLLLLILKDFRSARTPLVRSTPPP